MGTLFFLIFLCILSHFLLNIFVGSSSLVLQKAVICLLGSPYTLCSSSVWALGSQTLRKPSTHHAHMHHVPVFNTKAMCWGSLSPFSPLPKVLALLMRSMLARSTWVILVLHFQKRLIIQGKNVDMHYSHPRNKYEDWLCNTVSWRSVLYIMTTLSK